MVLQSGEEDSRLSRYLIPPSQAAPPGPMVVIWFNCLFENAAVLNDSTFASSTTEHCGGVLAVVFAINECRVRGG